MAKIAVELQRALTRRALDGAPGRTTARVLAQGDGWSVEDVMCTSGPQDRPFEERHSRVVIAIVAAGTFQYRSASGRELMTPGSLLLGNSGQSFECGHEHGAGDRCLSFHYALSYFERLAADTGAGAASSGFGVLRLPPLREFSPLFARACGGVTQPRNTPADISWEELSIQLAAKTVKLVYGPSFRASAGPPSSVARVTKTVRMIERRLHAPLTVGVLAREAGLSPYHFLRTFQHLTGVTPHQYILRARLRAAATRLASAEPARITDVALDSGFGDISNFNHAFRAEFGFSPRAFRLKTGGGGAAAKNEWLSVRALARRSVPSAN